MLLPCTAFVVGLGCPQGSPKAPRHRAECGRGREREQPSRLSLGQAYVQIASHL